MRAVWSFWTKPYFAGAQQGWCSGWYSEWHHWLAWGLSTYAAASHYPDTCLVTDDAGARMLADGLQLPFVNVSTALNRLKNEDPQWWALGKIEAYRRQTEPFVHIDTDVFLWQPFAERLANADVFTQNPEYIDPGMSCYRPRELDECLRAAAGVWIPAEWSSYGTEGQRAACCGVMGGRRVDFIQQYADAAVRMVTWPANRSALAPVLGKNGHMILIEQYLLTAFCESRGVEMRYVFDSLEEAYGPGNADAAGFTHLASSAKSDSAVCRDLEERVQVELPRYYERCRCWVERQQRIA